MKAFFTSLLLFFLTLPVCAGGYSPAPETAVTFPESDGNAEIAAAVCFVVVMVIGIIMIAAQKYRDKGQGDK